MKWEMLWGDNTDPPYGNSSLVVGGEDGLKMMLSLADEGAEVEWVGEWMHLYEGMGFYTPHFWARPIDE